MWSMYAFNLPLIERDGCILEQTGHGSEESLFPCVKDSVEPLLDMAVARIKHRLQES